MARAPSLHLNAARDLRQRGKHAGARKQVTPRIKLLGYVRRRRLCFRCQEGGEGARLRDAGGVGGRPALRKKIKGFRAVKADVAEVTWHHMRISSWNSCSNSPIDARRRAKLKLQGEGSGTNIKK